MIKTILSALRYTPKVLHVLAKPAIGSSGTVGHGGLFVARRVQSNVSYTHTALSGGTLGG